MTRLEIRDRLPRLKFGDGLSFVQIVARLNRHSFADDRIVGPELLRLCQAGSIIRDRQPGGRFVYRKAKSS